MLAIVDKALLKHLRGVNAYKESFVDEGQHSSNAGGHLKADPGATPGRKQPKIGETPPKMPTLSFITSFLRVESQITGVTALLGVTEHGHVAEGDRADERRGSGKRRQGAGGAWGRAVAAHLW